MPYVWVQPDVRLEHKGIKVYCAYEDDWADRKLDHWFSTLSEGGEAREFDVREIPGFDQRYNGSIGPERPGWLETETHINAVLCQAIDKGWLTDEGLALPTEEDQA